MCKRVPSRSWSVYWRSRGWASHNRLVEGNFPWRVSTRRGASNERGGLADAVSVGRLIVLQRMSVG